MLVVMSSVCCSGVTPLSLSHTHSLPPTQYSIIFPSQKIRNSWEDDFLRVKRSICSPLLATPTSSSRASPLPPSEGGLEFLHPLHVQSGRPGMEVGIICCEHKLRMFRVHECVYISISPVVLCWSGPASGGRVLPQPLGGLL